MQLRASSVRGERPVCPVHRRHRVHGNGSYDRYRDVTGGARRRIRRWRCTVCGLSISVLPDDMLPYRALAVGLLQAWMDAVLGGRDPPAVGEIERGCCQRALRRFHKHIPSLASAMGQMVATINPSASELWSTLRSLGDLPSILLHLAERFKLSLLCAYRCLRPATG